jgi:hypothetical protein
LRNSVFFSVFGLHVAAFGHLPTESSGGEESCDADKQPARQDRIPRSGARLAATCRANGVDGPSGGDERGRGAPLTRLELRPAQMFLSAERPVPFPLLTAQYRASASQAELGYSFRPCLRISQKSSLGPFPLLTRRTPHGPRRSRLPAAFTGGRGAAPTMRKREAGARRSHRRARIQLARRGGADA